MNKNVTVGGARPLRCFCLAATILGACWQTTSLGQDTEEATRLTAPRLFPDKTLAYLRVNDVQQLREDLSKSSLGKIGNDEKLKPILSEFYGSLVRNTEQMEAAIGLNLDELLSIPSGEFAVALLPSQGNSASASRSSSEAGERVEIRVDQPAVAMYLDAGKEISSVKVLLSRMDEEASERMVHEEKSLDRLTLHRYQNPDRARQQFGYFIDDGVIIACSDVAYLERLAEKWLGQLDDAKTLADNRTFTSLMSRCVGADGARPQVSFYLDPWSMGRNFSRNVSGSTMALAVLDSLGVSGIEAVGGSWIVGPADFDAITHLDIQLATPRRGVIGLLKPKSGSTDPEPWVPETVASYSTINWDIASTFQAVERLYNQFRGEDALQKEVFDRGSDRLGVDIRKDLVDNLEGRITIIQGFVKPVTVNSGSNVYAIRLQNMSYFKKNVLPKLLALVEERVDVRTASFGKLRVRIIPVGNAPPPDAPIRQPEFCVTTIDDYLVLADSQYMLREVSSCLNGTLTPLIDSLEFQLISERISDQLQDKECSAITFSRPEESLELFYRLAADKSNQERLRQVADNNGFFKALLSALDKHELPPFSQISKYLAPTGGFMVEEETGLHAITFGLRRE